VVVCLRLDIYSSCLSLCRFFAVATVIIFSPVNKGGRTTDLCAVFMVLLLNSCLLVGHRSNDFIVGLTNSHSALHTSPTLWNYTLCGQYPGAVPAGATVTVQCANVCERRLRFRYVIVQFPLINDQMNVCEVEVFTIGRLYLFKL